LKIAEAIVHERRHSLNRERYAGVEHDRDRVDLALQALMLVRAAIVDDPDVARMLFDR
jgi:hypothetical protein